MLMIQLLSPVRKLNVEKEIKIANEKTAAEEKRDEENETEDNDVQTYWFTGLNQELTG